MPIELAKKIFCRNRQRYFRYCLGFFVFSFLFLNPILLLPSVNANSVAGYSVQLALTPNDEHFADQTYLSRIHASESWDILRDHTLKKDAVIAVLDTGVDIDHPDLKNRIWTNSAEIPGDGIDNDKNSYIDDVHGWDFLLSLADPRPKISDNYVYEAVNHGTVVSGILAAEPQNSIGIAGASFSAKIMPLRVLDNKGMGNTLVLAQAIDYAVENHADVINLSLVGDVKDPRLEESITNAYKAGVAVVAASGNQENTGTNLNDSPRYPVCDNDTVNRVIGVAAVDENNKLATFSNYGSKCIDIAAPGAGLYSTVWYRDGDPKFGVYYSGGWTGTSVAAPLVSATLAAIKQVAPNLTVEEMYRALLSSTTSIADVNANAKDLGAGLINMKASLETAMILSRSKPTQIVMAAGKGFEPQVIIKDKTGTTMNEFLAYAKAFRGGVNVATGDVDGDGTAEIITAPRSDGGPHVRIFNQKGDVLGQFMAYDAQIRGGFSLVVGDVTGDGKADIIVVPISAREPQVKVFNGQGSLVGQFMAYAPSFRGGVNLALGDIDNDHVLEIITAPASRGGPHIRIFDSHGILKTQFMALDPSLRIGLSVASGDLDHDGTDDIAVTEITDHDMQVHIYNSTLTETNRFLLFPEIDSVEIPVSLDVSDYTGDKESDLLSFMVSPGMRFKVFDYYGQVIETVDLSRGDARVQATRFSFALLQ